MLPQGNPLASPGSLLCFWPHPFPGTISGVQRSRSGLSYLFLASISPHNKPRQIDGPIHGCRMGSFLMDSAAGTVYPSRALMTGGHVILSGPLNRLEELPQPNIAVGRILGGDRDQVLPETSSYSWPRRPLPSGVSIPWYHSVPWIPKFFLGPAAQTSS